MRALVASLVVLLATTSAAADETEDAALLHLDRGIAEFHAGKYAAAHSAFESARELVPDRANPYRWLALTEVQLGECPRALGNIEEFLRRVPADDERVAEMVRVRSICQRVTREPPPPPPSAPPPPRRPITRRWWFWTAVAGTAAAITGTVIWATAGDDPTVLPSINCDATGCRP